MNIIEKKNQENSQFVSTQNNMVGWIEKEIICTYLIQSRLENASGSQLCQLPTSQNLKKVLVFFNFSIFSQI